MLNEDMPLYRRTNAFTLVELLIVLSIIMVLVSILLPALNKARQAAVTLQCTARMRQLNTATFMYVNDNKGYLPPLTMQGQSWPSGHWTRPTIFPCGGDGYLTPYLAPTTVSGQYSGISTSKLYVCPELESDAGTNYTSGWSYRYNYILGGQDKIRMQAVYGGSWNDGSSHFYLPWKLSQVHDSTNVALFAEGDTLQPNSGNGLSQAQMALGLSPSIDPNGMYGHNSRYGIYVHGKKLTSTGFQGFTNIAYCDGSVRTVFWIVNQGSAYPLNAFPGTWINPYQTGVNYWSNGGSYN